MDAYVCVCFGAGGGRKHLALYLEFQPLSSNQECPPQWQNWEGLDAEGLWCSTGLRSALPDLKKV